MEIILYKLYVFLSNVIVKEFLINLFEFKVNLFYIEPRKTCVEQTITKCINLESMQDQYFELGANETIILFVRFDEGLN